MDVRKAAEAARDYLVSIRREFHQHPELSMQEFRTAQRIEEELDRLGIPHTRVGETGVLGTLRGEKEGGGAVVLRADIDALPIEETHECAYRSQNPGVMHACGHDAHAACLSAVRRSSRSTGTPSGARCGWCFSRQRRSGRAQSRSSRRACWTARSACSACIPRTI